MAHVLHVQLRYTIGFWDGQNDSNLWRSHRVRVWHTSFCSCCSSRVQIFVYGTAVPSAASIRTQNIYVHEVRKEGLENYHPGGEYRARLRIRITIRPNGYYLQYYSIFIELEIPDTTDCTINTEYTR